MPNPQHPPDGGFLKFIQFRKLEDKKDGQPTVWGIATQEQPDLDGEICNYDSAVAAYKSWSEAAAKRTRNAGQAVSFGNVRLQHGIEIGGKATKVTFDDDAKQVWLGSEPLNDEIRQQLKDGFYTGYSQGGSYGWRKCMECDSDLPLRQGYNFCEKCDKTVNVMYGLKKVAEVSYVDSPCSGEGFEHVKANGSREIVKFARRSEDDMPLTKEQLEALDTLVAKRKADKKTKRVAGEDLPHENFAYVGDPEKTATWKLPIKFSDGEKTKRHIRNALARFSQTKGIPDDKKEEVKAKIEAAAKENGIDVEAEGKKATALHESILAKLKAGIDAGAEKRGLQKGLYQVSRFAEVLESIAYLYEASIYERDMEGDDSEVPDQIAEDLDGLIETFLAMAEEEAKELAARTGKTTKGNTMTQEELDALNKAAKKTFASHFAKAAAHHEKLQAHHEDMAEKCHKMCKADVGSGAEEGNVEVAENVKEFGKALASHHEKMAKEHGKHAEHLHKMAKDHDEEEAEKTVKAIKAEQDNEPAPVVKTPVNDADAEFARKAREKADAALLADADFMKEVQEKRRANLLAALTNVDEEAKKAKDATIIPDGVKAGDFFAKSGVQPVSRDGDTGFKFASSGSTEDSSAGGL